MTYGVAWTSGNAAYLLADTLVMQAYPAIDERTNLDQLQGEVDGRHAAEALLKISALRPGVACTFACDDVDRAFDIVRFLREHAVLFATPTDLLTALNNSLVIGPDRGVEVLLAWALAGEAPQVVRWDSWTGNIEQGAVLQIGSLQHPHRMHHAASVQLAGAQFGDTPMVMLTAAMALMQGYCFHDDLIAQHVGGSVCGIFVQDGATAWQPDIVSLACAERQLQGYIASLVRDDILIVDSSYRDTFTVLNNTWEGDGRVERAQQWLARWHPLVSRYVPDDMRECRHWIFLNVRTRVLTVFVSHVPFQQNEDVFEVRATGDVFEVEFSEGFADLVFREPAPPYRNGTAFDFHVVQGALRQLPPA